MLNNDVRAEPVLRLEESGPCAMLAGKRNDPPNKENRFAWILDSCELELGSDIFGVY
jgi:hypothetical protein